VMRRSRKLMVVFSSGVGVNSSLGCRLFMYLWIWSGVVLFVL
jgi:hypothetical protein